MRRVPRLTRSSGLTSTTSTTANISRSTTSNISHPQRSAHFSSSSTSTTHTLLPQRRPIARSLCPPSLNRLYSSDKKPQSETETETETPTPTPTPTPTSVQEPVQEPAQEATQQKEQQDQIQAKREELDAEIQAKPLPTDADADKPLVPKLELETRAEEEEAEELTDDLPLASGPYATPPPLALAARDDEVADPTYAPALTSEGLETVGGLANWWDKRENWGAGGDFVGFRPRRKVTDPALLEAAVRRAVIEAFALRKAGREDELVAVWPLGLRRGETQGVLGREVKADGEGGVLFARGAEDVEAVAGGLRWREDEMDVIVSESVGVGEGEGEGEKEKELTADEAAALGKSWDPSWKAIRLEDARIRFAITKRLFQLTGQRIPDHQLEDVTTVQTLLHMVKKPPKPATLMEEIEKRHPSLLDLPNVTISAKRVTKGDKEKALGRFKIMQEEFKKRELPGAGHGYARKGKEIHRLQGGL